MLYGLCMGPVDGSRGRWQSWSLDGVDWKGKKKNSAISSRYM